MKRKPEPIVECLFGTGQCCMGKECPFYNACFPRATKFTRRIDERGIKEFVEYVDNNRTG